MSVGGLINAACGAGSIVMFCVCVIVLPQSSVKVQVIVCVPPHSSKLPASVPGTDPEISQLSVSLFVYAKVDTTKFCAASHVNVMSVGGFTNAACGAGSIVIVCTCVMFLPQSSVNVQVVVWLPPHSSKLPANVPGTVPAISQAPVSLFV